MRRVKILFILKERCAYGSKSKSYGLVNSCNFIASELKNKGICVKVVKVTDNNDIDREVTIYNPTHCFIEALWVVPDKFKILAKLHPSVIWIIRLHSKIPFLANESIAFKWLGEYDKLREHHNINLFIANNNKECTKELDSIFKGVLYLPNIYTSPKYVPTVVKKDEKNIINIGCFGALRPLKNTLQQAIWAIQFADKHHKQLIFHVNHTEHEISATDTVYKNLKALFANTHHILKTHDWLEHEEFLKLVCQMDIGMQISFTETFNIVAADFVHCNIPIIVSDEIDWIFPIFKADFTNSKDVLEKLEFAYDGRFVDAQWLNKAWLKQYNIKALNTWLKYLH